MSFTFRRFTRFVKEAPSSALADVDRVAIVSESGDITTEATLAELAGANAFTSTFAPVNPEVSEGGTGATDAATARANLGAAQSRSLRLTGTASNNVSTPDSPAWNPTSTLDLRAAVALDDWTPAANTTIISHFDSSGNQRAWSLGVDTAGRPFGWYSSSGSGPIQVIASTPAVVSDGGWLCVRSIWDASGPNVKMYTKPFKSLEDLALDTGWTQLGATLTSSVPGSIFDSSAPLVVGELVTSGQQFIGRIAGVIVGVDGVTVASPRFDSPVHPRYTDAQGNVWTFNGSAWSWANPS